MSFSRYVIFAILFTILVNAETKTPRLDAIEKMNKQLYSTVMQNKKKIAEQDKKIKVLSGQLLKYMQLQQKKQPQGSGFFPSDIDETMKAQNDEISTLYKYIYLLLFAIAALVFYTLYYSRNSSKKKDHELPENLPIEDSVNKASQEENTIVKEESVEVVKNSDSVKTELEPDVLKITSKDYLQKGIKFYSDGKYQDALDSFEHGIENLDEKSSLLAELYLAKAVTYDTLGQPHEAVGSYDSVIDTFKGESDDMLQEQVARAMVGKGVTLGKMKESKKAIKAYDEVIDTFGNSEIFNIHEQVARAMFNKGVRLGQLGRPREAIRVYSQVTDKYENKNQPILQELVARAIYNKGVRYTKLHDLESAIKAYDEVIRVFRGKSETKVQEQVARAMFNKAIALTKQDESQEAVTVYECLIRTYKDAQSVILSERVSSASANLAEIELKLKNDVTFDTENSIYKNLDFNNKLKFDMLFILSDAMKSPQDKEVQDWKNKYNDVSMEGYSFEELEKWSDNLDDVSIKYRVKEYIAAFKSHGIE